MYTGFWWGNLREGDHLEDPGVDGRVILRRNNCQMCAGRCGNVQPAKKIIIIFRKWDVRAWIGLMWLRIGTGGGHL